VRSLTMIALKWKGLSTNNNINKKKLVLCEYLKFQMETNRYFSIRLETSTIIRNFRILTVTNFLLI